MTALEQIDRHRRASGSARGLAERSRYIVRHGRAMRERDDVARILAAERAAARATTRVDEMGAA